jgi:hypothetical protein
MDQPEPGMISVSLTCVEAQSIMLLTESDSFPNRDVAASSTSKLRHALIASGFDPSVSVVISCTEAEARFIHHARQA